MCLAWTMAEGKLRFCGQARGGIECILATIDCQSPSDCRTVVDVGSNDYHLFGNGRTQQLGHSGAASRSWNDAETCFWQPKDCVVTHHGIGANANSQPPPMASPSTAAMLCLVDRASFVNTAWLNSLAASDGVASFISLGLHRHKKRMDGWNE